METILFEVSNQIGWLTLNRPEKLNAFNEQMNKEIVQVIKQIEKNDDVRAVVIRGAGRAFCAGEDLSSVNTDTDFGDVLRERYNPMVKRLAYLEKPVVAAIDGAAAGAGLSLALACDFRIASDKASFLEAFIHVGLVPDSGNLYYLPRIVGYAKAMELAILGEKINADQAKELGLVTKVFPQEEFEQGVQAFAERLAKMPTKAVGFIKRYMQQSYETNLSQMLEYEAYAQGAAGKTEDHEAGVQAFLNKQKPVFKGK
ncbi:2-(1,2-epoxy-1,2-dihydrophenyl)acetyl-CoA isomerase [Scopulibacillus daqui]|uniref:2-(1,2-epoxy-1,2-dihydrophenyl)acetyl-CoA isomerase n=1 Tax=Scopulibacillus daqui TaxID=1469162 RepID=A0ABS2PWL2_9BACL|nr:enoyl-CoA hydratase-related protein [Scopulibacillus daqui]MBM7643849.1 2-(1,2-epoxy-1,2-dihydrophenyl)acetyl-CoA isomerase [Scopulibacillus daqui]